MVRLQSKCCSRQLTWPAFFPACPRLPQADIRNVNFTLPPSSQCSEEQVAQQAEFVQQQTGNLSAVWAEGLTLHVLSNTANLPVLSGTTGKQGEHLQGG